jgi:prepilin-type N-terminal cleavage/methylation domain-containing protein
MRVTGRPHPRAGFSLVELMIVITVIGIMLAMVVPSVQGTLVRRNLQGSRAAVVNLYARARVTALQQRRATTLNFNGTSAWITAPRAAGGIDTIGAVTDLQAQYGVAVAASGTVTILPTGLVNAGTPIQINVTKSGKSDSVMISGYGRLQ